MNYNQVWSGNRGRSRGNRGCGRGRRGSANLHYRGGGHSFHRNNPPLLNPPEPFYSTPRFRGLQENFNHLYSHQPLNQESPWSLTRNRSPFNSTLRQTFLPATRIPPLLPNRSSSPLPGSEEYMQKNICEKSAFLKRQLELEGFNNSFSNFELSEEEYQSDNTNNNFCENTYQKPSDADDKLTEVANESIASPRRNKKRQLNQRTMSVEEIHEKIINHISNLSHGKKINLVNLPGPSGYDKAIQEITRQKRMELSKALRDMCNNKFKEIEDSSQVINAIIPDFDIKIEELPRELVEQLSSTLNENVTERIHNLCIDPEVMFEQAAEMLSTSLELDTNVEGSNIEKVDLDYQDFPNSDRHDGIQLGLQSIEDTNLSMAIDESINTENMLGFENPDICESAQMNYNTSQSINFNIPPQINYMPTQSCSGYDTEFLESTNANRMDLESRELFITKPNTDIQLYSPCQESSESTIQENLLPEHSNLENINPSFELMDIPEPSEILVSSHNERVAELDTKTRLSTDLMSEEAELTACLAETNPDSNLLNVNNGNIVSSSFNKTDTNNADEHTNNFSKDVAPIEEKQSNSNTEETHTCVDTAENVIVTQEEKKKSLTVETEINEKSSSPILRNHQDDIKNMKKDDSNDVTKENHEFETDPKLKSTKGECKKKVIKNKKSKLKSNDMDEVSKKSLDGDEHCKKKFEKKIRSKHEDDSRKSLEKDETYDKCDQRQTWDKYATAESVREHTNEDEFLERRRHDRRQDEKKLKGKYEEDYYRSDKYERSRYDSYQGQTYDDIYRKKYKDSNMDEDNKHRRSDFGKSFEKYRNLDSDLYHYSKYPKDVDDGHSSKRYYQEKIVYPYRQEYEYSHHKYDYPPSDYYQNKETSYPSEDYEQKVYCSKSHKSKYKKHSKKHKRHMDHSSGSNASSSGSDRNSSTSSNYKQPKHISKPDIHDSSEESHSNKYPKTSLKERIEVLCGTKICNTKPEQISSKADDGSLNSKGQPKLDATSSSTVTTDVDTVENDPLLIVAADIKTESLEETQFDATKEKSDCEDDLKNDTESSESKKYSQRPWKSPGEKKLMMEHLQHNPVQEDDDFKVYDEIGDCKDDIAIPTIENVVQEESQLLSTTVENPNNCQPSENENCEFSGAERDNLKTSSLENFKEETTALNKDDAELDATKDLKILNSAEVSSTSETGAIKTEIVLEENPLIAKEIENIVCEKQTKDSTKMLVTTYTQTITDKENSQKKKKDCNKDKVVPKEKLKCRQNSFTQTIVINASTSTQTQKEVDVIKKNKTVQTDPVVEVTKENENKEMYVCNISKPLKRKHCVEQMFEIDKEIDRLTKQRQQLYNKLKLDSDSENEIERAGVKVCNTTDGFQLKQKHTHKEKTKSTRETKHSYSESKRHQEPQKISITKRSNTQKQEAEKKSEIVIEEKCKQTESVSITAIDQDKTKVKFKRGRPKRNQDKINAQTDDVVQKVEEPQTVDTVKNHINKKPHLKQYEVEKDLKLEVSYQKSNSKNKIDAIPCRRKSKKHKLTDDHPKAIEDVPPKRLKKEEITSDHPKANEDVTIPKRLKKETTDDQPKANEDVVITKPFQKEEITDDHPKANEDVVISKRLQKEETTDNHPKANEDIIPKRLKKEKVTNDHPKSNDDIVISKRLKKEEVTNDQPKANEDVIPKRLKKEKLTNDHPKGNDDSLIPKRLKKEETTDDHPKADEDIVIPKRLKKEKVTDDHPKANEDIAISKRLQKDDIADDNLKSNEDVVIPKHLQTEETTDDHLKANEDIATPKCLKKEKVTDDHPKSNEDLAVSKRLQKEEATNDDPKANQDVVIPKRLKKEKVTNDHPKANEDVLPKRLKKEKITSDHPKTNEDIVIPKRLKKEETTDDHPKANEDVALSKRLQKEEATDDHPKANEHVVIPKRLKKEKVTNDHPKANEDVLPKRLKKEKVTSDHPKTNQDIVIPKRLKKEETTDDQPKANEDVAISKRLQKEETTDDRPKANEDVVTPKRLKKEKVTSDTPKANDDIVIPKRLKNEETTDDHPKPNEDVAVSKRLQKEETTDDRPKANEDVVTSKRLKKEKVTSDHSKANEDIVITKRLKKEETTDDHPKANEDVTISKRLQKEGTTDDHPKANEDVVSKRLKKEKVTNDHPKANEDVISKRLKKEKVTSGHPNANEDIVIPKRLKNEESEVSESIGKEIKSTEASSVTVVEDEMVLSKDDTNDVKEDEKNVKHIELSLCATSVSKEVVEKPKDSADKVEAVSLPNQSSKENEDKSNINSNVVVEDKVLKPTIILQPFVGPKILIPPEVTNASKKKKRRLSGVIDYRKKKKKKKSKNKSKKIVAPIKPEIMMTKSTVKVMRFSLEQLINMRNNIRNKHNTGDFTENTESSSECKVSDTCLEGVIDVERSKPNEEDVAIQSDANEKPEETISSTEVVRPESVEVESPSDTNQEKDNYYTLDFKNFNGAILVIKVIENTVLAASDKGEILYFNIENGELIKTIDVSKLAITSLVMAKHNDSNFVYTGSLDSCLTIINFDSKELIRQEVLTEPIQCMECSWNFIFIGSDRGSLIRFDLNLEKVVDSLKVSNFNILMMRAAQEGPRKILVVAMRNSPVCIRDAISGLLLRTMITSFSPTVYTLLIDKNLVYCGTSQHDILVYTFEDGQLILQHEATKSKGVVCMQIVENLLFAGCYNGNIYIYDTKTNIHLGTMTGPGGLMLSMEIVKDKIIVGTKSGNFKAWKIPQEYMEKM
ncbi:hypothetical protein FQA39_LY03422 [Lamprigera yunnana]|nr:hypothetical protein FQA39_LY03422 [Lamprigera yunnana]